MSELKKRIESSPEHVFHASLPLYIILEKRPRPENPDWTEVGCYECDGVNGMMVYLSLIDATLDRNVRNRNGGRYEIYPFESIDPRHFIRENNDWFTVWLVYGFAAQGNQLLCKKGEIMSLMHATHFHIQPNMDHFHLHFSEKTVEWLNKLHIAAGIPDYASIMADLSDSSTAEIDRLAQEAMACIEQETTSDANDIKHCALYDPIERQWRCVALELEELQN